MELAIDTGQVLLARTIQIAAFPVISSVVLEAENVGVAREPLDVLLDSHEKAADLLGVSGHVQALDVILYDYSNFLKKKI